MEPFITFTPGNSSDSYVGDTNFGLLLSFDMNQQCHVLNRMRVQLLSYCCGSPYLHDGHELVSCSRCWTEFKVSPLFQDHFMVLELPRVWPHLQPLLTLPTSQDEVLLEVLSMRLALFVDHGRGKRLAPEVLCDKFSGPLR